MNFPSTYIQRNFQHFYHFKKDEKENLDQYLYLHPNSIVVIGLTETHQIFKSKLENFTISFPILKSEKQNFKQKNKKKKNEKLFVTPETIICEIKLSNEKTIPIFSLVYGTLCERNENLIKNPNLLIEDPYEKGFIGIILLRKEKHLDSKQNFQLEKGTNFFTEKEFEEYKLNIK
ncbi:hypothetical protein M0811_01368 [Anaeramoeba ignava]|uniref:Protein Abitram n=1 Tax=Anaeramoeba ignava TaxID=1746090 RepID=A0A9Q0R9S3_ANAIG|nr:hypothetical protein M0811_01368 [Anaeramoeba ignava]